MSGNNRNRSPETTNTSDLGTFGRCCELPLEKMTADQKRAYEFTVKERGECLGNGRRLLEHSLLIRWGRLRRSMSHKEPFVATIDTAYSYF